MFHTIPQPILERMAALEDQDARDRFDGTPQLKRLRQIPPETGRFLALMAAAAPQGAMLEIGTSAGYSALWISLALRERAAKGLDGSILRTFEILPEKVTLARETVRQAQVEDFIEIIPADARQRLHEYEQIAFCFLDSEKDLYLPCYDQIVPNLVPGGIFLADNAISHQAELRSFLDRVFADPRLDAQVVPVGKGVLLCRKGIG